MSRLNNFIERINRDFARIYKGQKPEFVSRAAGRVELIGGHTDYNEGFVIAAAIDRSFWVGAARRAEQKICIYSEWAGQSHEFKLSTDLTADKQCKWANYGRGVAAVLMQQGLELRGANLYIAGDLPVGAGLGSSAALEVSIAQAMLRISGYNDTLSAVKLAQVCQTAENVYAGSPCGIMDQMVCITGKREQVVFLDCRDLQTELLPLPARQCCIMIFNSMVRHEVGGGEYGKRRKQCQQACKAIAQDYPQVKALRDVSREVLAEVKGRLEPVLLSRAEHVTGENARVLAAREALQKMDVKAFGRLMSESHNSSRDLFESSCAQLDFLVEQITGCEGAYGARLSGGGFGGAAVAVVNPKAVQYIEKKVAESYKKKFNIDCEIHVARPWQGIEIIEL
jgi:galactokinase